MEGPDTHRGGCRGRARSWGEGRPRHIPGREYGGAGHVPGGGGGVMEGLGTKRWGWRGRARPGGYGGAGRPWARTHRARTGATPATAAAMLPHAAMTREAGTT